MRSTRPLFGPIALLLLAASCGGSSTFAVGGTVSGLAGSGLVLQDNAGDDLAINADGNFEFKKPVAGVYAVTVSQQPTGPAQICTVANGSGTATSRVASVAVACVTSAFPIGGTVSGLSGQGLVLQDDGGDDLAVQASGAFTFARPVESGKPFAVTIKTQPQGPSQACRVSGGSGTVVGGAVSSVAVGCATNQFNLGGTVTGLAGTGLVLQTQGNADLPINSAGAFAFATPVASGSAFAVAVKTQPSSPSQTCSIANDHGIVGSSDINNIAVTCVTNSYSIGGTVAGLAGSGLVLQDNGGDNLAVTANGGFTFTTKVASGGTFAVTVLSEPSSPAQACSVSGGSGTVGGSAVGSVSITCTTLFTIGGSVSGLAGTGLSLTDNGGDALGISTNGGFTFATPLASGSAYSVAVKTQPVSPWQTCSTASGTGTVGSAPVTSVAVSCAINSYNIVAKVSGLAGTGFALQDNGGDNLSVSGNGNWTFATKVRSGSPYNVTVLTQPTAPWQTCSGASPNGTAGGADVTVAVSCATNQYTIGGTVSGLTGSGLVLQDNGAGDLPISSSGGFTFGARVASGSTYLVTVKTQPANQNCVVGNGSGTVSSGAVTNVTVSCT